MAVVDLEQAKKYLNITVPTYDNVLPGYITSAVATLSELCGPLEPTDVTTRLRICSGTRSLVLPITPVASLTTVTPYGSAALDVSTLHVDPDAGIVTYNSTAAFTGPYVDVTYQAGRATCPADLVLAVKELVRHLWQANQRGTNGKPGTAASDATANTVPGAAYLLPFRVSELIAPHQQLGIS